MVAWKKKHHARAFPKESYPYTPKIYLKVFPQANLPWGLCRYKEAIHCLHVFIHPVFVNFHEASSLGPGAIWKAQGLLTSQKSRSMIFVYEVPAQK